MTNLLLKIILLPLISGQIVTPLPEQPDQILRRGAPMVVAVSEAHIKAFEADNWTIINQSETADGTIFYCVKNQRSKL